MSTQDKVQLSERERQQLAGIKAMLESGDPRLARVLTGQKGRFGAAAVQRRRSEGSPEHRLGPPVSR
jgi:hypothetical protein